MFPVVSYRPVRNDTFVFAGICRTVRQAYIDMNPNCKTAIQDVEVKAWSN